MGPVAIILIIAGVLFLGGLVAMIAVTLPIAKKVYNTTLVRTEPDKWGRVCSAPENAEQLSMWNDGCRWAEENAATMREVSVESDGLKLYGEYYDFGSDECVIILPGRCECLKYSYYYAAPYKRAGLNVLVIDQRAHGKSDGKYSTAGMAEGRDLAVWADLAKNRLGIKGIFLHCVCIGCATGLTAVTSEDASGLYKGLVLDGCFTSFRETYRRHMIVDKRPLFPVLDMIMLLLYKNTGNNVLKNSPKKMLPRLKLPVIFIHGKKDLYSLPEKAQMLFDKTGSTDKRIVWMEEGCHSHLRFANTEKYDRTVEEFVADVRS